MDHMTARGWLTDKERNWLFILAQSVKPKQLIFNVGVEYGASIVCFCEGNKSARVIGVDIDPLKFTDHKYTNFNFIQRDSTALAAEWKKRISLLFIDGGHTRSIIKKDLAYTNFVKVGGHAAFHDCYSWDAPLTPHKICPEVNEEISRWYSLNRDKWIELPVIDSIRTFRRL